MVVALGLSAFWLEPASLTLEEQRVSLRGSARGSLRIAILTDLHVGSPFNGIAKLREIVARTNGARPDVVCILGDLVIQGVIGGRFVAPEDIAAELKHLRATAGVVAVLGNHDGWLNHDRVRDALERNGIRVLEETAARLSTPAGPVWIAGISDLWTGRHDVATALAAVRNDDAPVILMTHDSERASSQCGFACRPPSRCSRWSSSSAIRDLPWFRCLIKLMPGVWLAALAALALVACEIDVPKPYLRADSSHLSAGVPIMRGTML